MKFSRLTISNWKQFHEIDLNFHDRLTILTGANGSGKTTLLNLLARHFGWYFNELSLPIRDKSSGTFKWFPNYFKKFRNKDTENNSLKIGELYYTNGVMAKLLAPKNVDAAQYQIWFDPEQSINGLNIVSHRDIFRYQQVTDIPTTKITRKTACQVVHDTNKGYYTQSHGSRQNTNFSIKQTLLSWAIFGPGNKNVEADYESEQNFEGFQDILKKLLPPSIGFKSITMRNSEAVFITDTGEFVIDSVSGGIASIIDIAWQIYNFSNTNEESIVLIDEIENHLHPTMQRCILPDLIRAFPNVQFIVSTHSALVVGSVKDSKAYAFRYNDQKKVFSESLDMLNKAKTATEILNEVLGISFTMPIWAEEVLVKLVKKYRCVELTEKNIDEMRNEFKTEGLESLMPTAIGKVFAK